MLQHNREFTVVMLKHNLHDLVSIRRTRLFPHPGSQAPAWEPSDSQRLAGKRGFPSWSLGTRGVRSDGLDESLPRLRFRLVSAWIGSGIEPSLQVNKIPTTSGHFPANPHQQGGGIPWTACLIPIPTSGNHGRPIAVCLPTCTEFDPSASSETWAHTLEL